MDARTLVAVVASPKERVTERALESVARLQSPAVDVLVFDGDPAVCARAGLTAYCSPRPLSPARTMNVAFLRALSHGYEAVLQCEPNVTVPSTAVAALAQPGRIASVAAWCTAGLEQDIVDWIPTAFSDPPAPVDVDASATGPCLLFTAGALRDVGLFDPIYVSGPDHLIDWSQRAASLGYRCVAAPGVHVSGAGTPHAVPASALVNFRHPSYKPAGPVPGALDPATASALVAAAARRFGYTLEVGWPNGADDATEVRVTVEPDGERPVVTGRFCGFSAPLALDRAGDVRHAISTLLGGEPRQVIVSEPGRFAKEFAGAAPFMYPKKI